MNRQFVIITNAERDEVRNDPNEVLKYKVDYKHGSIGLVHPDIVSFYDKNPDHEPFILNHMTKMWAPKYKRSKEDIPVLMVSYTEPAADLSGLLEEFEIANVDNSGSSSVIEFGPKIEKPKSDGYDFYLTLFREEEFQTVKGRRFTEIHKSYQRVCKEADIVSCREGWVYESYNRLNKIPKKLSKKRIKEFDMEYMGDLTKVQKDMQEFFEDQRKQEHEAARANRDYMHTII